MGEIGKRGLVIEILACTRGRRVNRERKGGNVPGWWEEEGKDGNVPG